MDKYLKAEVGNRSEITSSMVGLAAEAREKDFWVGYKKTTEIYLSQLAAQQSSQGAPYSVAGGLGNIYGGLGFAAMPQNSYCPYCGMRL